MNESLNDILMAICELEAKKIETKAALKKCKDVEKSDFLDMFLITVEATIQDLIEDSKRFGHICTVCNIIVINSKKTKVNCISCVEDFEKCKDETIMNFGQFAQRQLERIEIFKVHRPQEITAMQLKEDLQN